MIRREIKVSPEWWDTLETYLQPNERFKSLENFDDELVLWTPSKELIFIRENIKCPEFK